MGTRNVSEVTEADISRMMVGRDVVEVIEKTKATPGMLSVQMHCCKCCMLYKLSLNRYCFVVIVCFFSISQQKAFLREKGFAKIMKNIYYAYGVNMD